MSKSRRYFLTASAARIKDLEDLAGEVTPHPLNLRELRTEILAVAAISFSGAEAPAKPDELNWRDYLAKTQPRLPTAFEIAFAKAKQVSEPPEAATEVADEDPESVLFELISQIYSYRFGVQDPSPQAEFGDKISPVMGVTKNKDGSIRILFYPYPNTAFDPETKKIKKEAFDYDLYESMRRFINKLAKLAAPKVLLKEDAGGIFRIKAPNALYLLDMCQRLMTTEGMPSLDTVHLTFAMGKDSLCENEKGSLVPAFDNGKEYRAYVREHSLRDRGAFQQFAKEKPGPMMMHVPARPFINFDDAARAALFAKGINEETPFIHISLPVLRKQLADKLGVAADTREINPLLGFH